jgi:hypothetical protein
MKISSLKGVTVIRILNCEVEWNGNGIHMCNVMYQFNFCCLEGMFSKPEISLVVRLQEITGKVCKWQGDAVGFMV